MSSSRAAKSTSLPYRGHALHDLLGCGCQRHRHRQLARRLEAEVEVLQQELGREGRLEVEVDVGGALVPGERRAHHAVVEELEEIRSRHPALLRQHRDLGHALRDHAEHQVVADLHQPRQLPLADVGDATRQHLQQWPRLHPRVVRARGDDRQPAARRNLWVAADRRRKHRGPAALHGRTDARRHRRGDRRGVDDQARKGVVAREQPGGSADDILYVRRTGDHREHDVPVGQIRRRVDDRGPQRG